MKRFMKLESNKPPLVSIVIPIYNVSKYLEKCLDSVICQTYSNIEILLVDDGSTDESGSICDKFAQIDERVRVLHQIVNLGLATARNIGIDNAKGEYLLFIDSDDWIEHDTVYTMLFFAIKYHAEIVICRNYTEYRDKTICPPELNCRIKILRGHEILPEYINGTIGTVVWKKLYRKTCFDKIRFPDGHNSEDIYITWLLLKELDDNNNTIVVLSDVLFHYRMRKSSITNTRSFYNIFDYWEANKKRYEGLICYKEQLLPGCMLSIGRMWMNYFGFSKPEKQKAKSVLKEMEKFSNEYFEKVICGKYSLIVKLSCLISQNSSFLLMPLYFCLGRIRLFFGKYIKKLYD